MTPKTLLEELKDELELLFADYKLKNKEGIWIQPAVYKHDIPKKKASDNTSFAPYQIVSLESGNIQSLQEPYTVKAMIIFCVWNGFDDQNGDEDVLNQIDRVVNRFTADSILGAYVLKYPIDWTTETQVDTYPYSIGGMELTFECPVKEREDLLT